jgi:TctA family transporter
VLGNLFETSLRQAVMFKHGEIYRFFTEHPIALFLFAVTAAMLFGPLFRKYWPKRMHTE